MCSWGPCPTATVPSSGWRLVRRRAVSLNRRIDEIKSMGTTHTYDVVIIGAGAIGMESDSELEKLGAGEREAILLACEQQPQALLLIDEGKGRRAASRWQIRMIGTLGMLELAAARDLLDLPTAVERLTRTTFYITPGLLRTFLERHSRRKKVE